jgi:hypothetical protein
MHFFLSWRVRCSVATGSVVTGSAVTGIVEHQTWVCAISIALLKYPFSPVLPAFNLASLRARARALSLSLSV